MTKKPVPLASSLRSDLLKRGAVRSYLLGHLEIVIVAAILVLVFGICLPLGVRRDKRLVQAYNTVRVLKIVQDAKTQFGAEVRGGYRPMPVGYTAETFPAYNPTLRDLSSFMRVNGLPEGAIPSEQRLMAGTGERSLEIGPLAAKANCYPAVPKNDLKLILDRHAEGSSVLWPFWQ